MWCFCFPQHVTNLCCCKEDLPCFHQHSFCCCLQLRCRHLWRHCITGLQTTSFNILLDYCYVAFLPFLQNSFTLLKVASVRRRRSGSAMSTLLHLIRPFELGSPSYVCCDYCLGAMRYFYFPKSANGHGACLRENTRLKRWPILPDKLLWSLYGVWGGSTLWCSVLF